MKVEPAPVAGDILRVALPFGDRAVFEFEYLSRFFEALLDLEHACARFAAQREVPVLREVHRLGERVLPGGGAPVLIVEIRGALPVARVLAFVDVASPV